MRVVAYGSAVILCSLAIGGFAVWTPAPPPPLPPGHGASLVLQSCQQCHTTEIISQQKLSKVTWGKVVDKMTRWGAPVATGDKEALIEYLAEHFGAAAQTPHEQLGRPKSGN